MPGKIILAVGQLGPVARGDSRERVVKRLVDMLAEGGIDLDEDDLGWGRVLAGQGRGESEERQGGEPAAGETAEHWNPLGRATAAVRRSQRQRVVAGVGHRARSEIARPA